MKKNIIIVILILIIAGLVAISPQVNILDRDSNETDIENAAMAKVTMGDALQKVMKDYDGFIITSNLERKPENQLVYEIDLVQNDKEVEIWVNAVTGELSELMAD